MTQRHLLVFTFLVSFVLNAYSAIELRSTQMRTSDGLPNNSIRYIYQDSKGFLWLATLNGLSRYDGNSFVRKPEIKCLWPTTGFTISQKIKMAFYGFPLHLNYIAAMICNVPVLLITRVAAS